MSPLSSSVPQSLSFSYTHVRPRCSQNSSGNLWDPIPNLDNITPTALSSEPTLHPSVYEAVLSQVDCQDSAGLEAVLRLWNIWHIFKLTCSLWSDAVTWFLLIFQWVLGSDWQSWILEVLSASLSWCLCLLGIILQRIVSIWWMRFLGNERHG